MRATDLSASTVGFAWAANNARSAHSTATIVALDHRGRAAIPAPLHDYTHAIAPRSYNTSITIAQLRCSNSDPEGRADPPGRAPEYRDVVMNEIEESATIRPYMAKWPETWTNTHEILPWIRAHAFPSLELRNWLGQLLSAIVSSYREVNTRLKRQLSAITERYPSGEEWSDAPDHDRFRSPPDGFCSPRESEFHYLDSAFSRVGARWIFDS